MWASPADAEVHFVAPAGAFSVPHGLGVTPALVLIQMTSSGAVWLQSVVADETNVYLEASDAGLTGYVQAWKSVPSVTALKQGVVPLAPSDPGAFAVPHGLGAVPSLILIRMSSGGVIYEASPADSTNLNLVASDGGITGTAEVWL